MTDGCASAGGRSRRGSWCSRCSRSSASCDAASELLEEWRERATSIRAAGGTVAPTVWVNYPHLHEAEVVVWDLKPGQALVSTTKGIEPDRFLLMSQVLEELCPNNPVAVISGPNLAKEIAKRELAATVIASTNSDLRRNLQESLSCSYFRVYASDDLYGVELGGALKNIYAIVVTLEVSHPPMS